MIDMSAFTGKLSPDKRNKVRIVLTGSAGHLGSTILRILKGSGFEVYGLLLPGEKEKVTDPDFRYFHGNVCDKDSMRCLFLNTDGRKLIVIHTAAIISIAEKIPPAMYDVNVNGVRNIISLCREYGAERLVYVCSVHAIEELPEGQTIREPESFSKNTVKGGYAKTKAEAAQSVLDAAADGLDAVTVYPSGIMGPYDEGSNHLIQMVVEYMNGSLPACVRGGYDFADVRDVAAGCLLAADHGQKGQGYILSGHYLTISSLLSIAAHCTGGKEVRIIPMWLARLAVPAIGLYAKLRHRRPLYTGYSLDTLNTNSSFSNEKAVRELGYSVRDPEETVADTVKWLQGVRS